MAFLDKLGNLAKNAADKTNEMMETSKLNSKIAESKSKIAARKTQIGEYYWAKYESGETLDAEAMELCDAIRSENEAIEGFTLEIQKIKAAPPPAPVNEASGEPAFVSCEACGAAIPAGKKFCPECGAPAVLPQPEPRLENAACPSCGQPVPAGKKFCPECGTAMPVPQPQPVTADESVAAEPVRCASCGEVLPEGKRFCPECGAPASVQ